jgi:hypothetical protein
MSTNSKASLFDLYPQDRAAIARIRERLELHSNALVVRIALRDLARRLEEGQKKVPLEVGK